MGLIVWMRKEIGIKMNKQKKRVTLEMNLHNLAEHDENVKNLESVFDIQKRKLTRYMASVVTTFPTYSSHDSIHSASIIAAIEKILGKKRIKNLSGIDTFFILMCAYMHDMGMLYSENEVRALWKSEEFRQFLRTCQQEKSELSDAASIIFQAENGECNSPLDIRNAITLLLMEYFRPRHGNRIYEVTNVKLSEIGERLAVQASFLPERIIQMIYKISVAHTAKFEKIISELPLSDTFGAEEFHPRMIAYLIRLGDLCDMDNNRFNYVGIKLFGNMDQNNLSHYFKHKSVKTLYLSPEQINVVADIDINTVREECDENWFKSLEEQEKKNKVNIVFQNTVREQIKWKEWMTREITNAKLYQIDIFPSKKMAVIPEIQYKILINGKETASALENLKLRFSPEKAFRLIESLSIYQDRKFIFIRELIQNALDATKLQIWREICADSLKLGKNISPFDVERIYPGIFQKYAIEITSEYDFKTNMAELTVRDKGIGISIEEFKQNILTTGRSWNEREEYKSELYNMPEWLMPTGAFGIGLHTVFSVADCLTIRTKSDKENFANEMTLYAGKRDGYAFCQKIDEYFARGSEFSFRFRLTNDLRNSVSGSNQISFLHGNISNQLEKTIIGQLTETCISPLVSINMNGKQIVSPFVDCDWHKELLMDEKRNKIIDKTISSSRYIFAFSNDYYHVSIWDKKELCCLRFSVGEAGGYNISYKGINVEETISMEDKSFCLALDMLDILGGNGTDWIVASRMKLSNEAMQKAQRIVKDAVVFIRKIYVKFINEYYNQSDIIMLNKESDSIAREIMEGKIKFADFWDKICKLKFRYYRSNKTCILTEKTLTYFLAVKILEKGMKLGVIENARDIKKEWKIIGYVDKIIKMWKADWKGSDEYFYKDYLDEQMKKVMEHFLNIAGMLAVRDVARMRTQNRYIYKNSVIQKSINLYHKNCLFCSQWKKTANLYERMVDVYMAEETGENLIWRTTWKNILFVPISEQIFNDWKESKLFSSNISLQLYLNFPCRDLVLDLPGFCQSHDEEDVIAWQNIMTESYLTAQALPVRELLISDVANLLQAGTVNLRYPVSEKVWDIFPFISQLRLQKYEKNNEITLGLEGTENIIYGVQVSSEIKNNIFRDFWRRVEENTEEEGYCEILAITDYPLLGVLYTGSNYFACIGFSVCYPQIPIWDYAMNIRDFLHNYIGCNIDEELPSIVEMIMEAEQTQSVINYIYSVRHTSEMISLEDIKNQYQSFLYDLINCWADEHNCPRG